MATCLRFLTLQRIPLPCRSTQRQSPPVRCRQEFSPAAPSPTLRRTANFQPTMLNDAYVQSLSTVSFKDDVYIMRRDKLKDDVSHLILEDKGLVDQLELIDSLQQLSIAYIFEKQIKDVLSYMHSLLQILSDKLKDDLHATSLLFRLLREYGFTISQDVLVKSFKDEYDCFKSNIFSDAKGLLSLYEATFFAEDGEEKLDEGRIFAEKHLIEMRMHLVHNNDVVNCGDNQQLLEYIDHALELPLHWRTPRLHSMWFFTIYEKNDNLDPRILELAKLDFNIIQSNYKMELKEISRWWRKLDLANDKLTFVRDWPVESYIWTIGLVSEPQFSRCRKELARIVCFLHLVDDIYDVYGSLDELEVFTNAIDRWETAAMDDLPEYMKPCFIALLNTVNEVACATFKNEGVDILHYLKRAWSDICKAFLKEARWYNSGYIPTLEEYMDNAWISVAAPLTLVFSQCLSKNLNMESLKKFEFYPSSTQYSSTIFRFYDDIGTSKAEIERGDVAKSIQCYMKEKQVAETIACKHMRDLIYKNWKLLNGERVVNSQLEDTYKRVVMNLPRMAHFMYDNRDGNGKPNHRMKDLIMSLLIEPVPL